MGKYTVPENIRKQKPKGSIVKVIHNKYYVYEHFYRKDENGNWKTKSGKLIGQITEEQGFIPNNNYMVSEEVTTLEYGQYAVVSNNSTKTLSRLLEHFNPMDAYTIYLMALVHVVNGFTPLKNIHTFIEQSYLSLKHKNVRLSYHHLSTILDALGRRQERVHKFEQSLLDESSKEIAIDGHDIKSTSHENDLSENGNKYSTFQDMQLNVLMAYDINTEIPLMSRAFPGATLDKTSVKELLDFHSFHDTLFIIDRGFYSKENLKLFSENGNHYIIPLSPNLKEYKEATKDMEFHNVFVYEKEKKMSTIEYKEVKVDETTKIIVYRDLAQNAKDKTDYLKNMERNPEKYTMEKYEEIKDFFGVLVLQNNLDKNASEIYKLYKNRWKIETFFNYFKNNVDLNALGLSDYYTTQGMTFIMLVVGLIYQELKEAVKNVKGKSIDDCLLETRFVKLNKRNNVWMISNAKKDLQEMFRLLNVDLFNPLS